MALAQDMVATEDMVATASGDCEMLMRVFLNADGLTHAARQMVINGLPPATRVSGGKLHPFQSQFLTIVKDTLVDLTRDAERRQVEHEDKLELLKKQMEEGTVAREAVGKDVEKATQLVQEKTNALIEIEKLTREIEYEHEQLLKSKIEEDERRTELDTSKGEVTSILEGPFQLLLQGECGEAKDITAAVGAVETFLKRIGTEPTLVAAAVRALAVKPDSRRDFDALTISCIKQTLETQLNKVSTLIDDHHSKHRSVAAEQLGLWALLDEEKSRVTAARAELVDVEVVQSTAKTLCSNAEKEMKARKDAINQQLCEKVIVDDMVREIAGAHAAVARLADFNYEAITPMEAVEESAVAAAPDASGPDTSADVSMAATTG